MNHVYVDTRQNIVLSIRQLMPKTCIEKKNNGDRLRCIAQAVMLRKGVHRRQAGYVDTEIY